MSSLSRNGKRDIDTYFIKLNEYKKIRRKSNTFMASWNLFLKFMQKRILNILVIIT